MMSTTAVPTLCVKCGLPIVGHISYIGTSCASPHHPECLGQKSYYELEQQLTAEREVRKEAEKTAALRARAALAWKQRAESAEQKLREAQEQEPVGYVDGEQFKRWDILRGTEFESPERCYLPFSKVPFTSELSDCDFPLYAAPIPPADVAELQRENEQYAKDVLQLIKQLRYCIGIAERGTGREQREDEIGELFLLEYVKELERKLAE